LRTVLSILRGRAKMTSLCKKSRDGRAGRRVLSFTARANFSNRGKTLKLSNNNNANHARTSIRHHRNPHSDSYLLHQSSFFLDWARKPSLYVMPRQNNLNEGIKPAFTYHKGDYPKAEYTPTCYFARWTEDGSEEISKLIFKFGGLSVFNEPRNLFRLILHAGRATNLRADIFATQIAEWQNNKMVNIPENKQIPRGPFPLYWYRTHWDEPDLHVHSTDTKASAKQTIQDWKNMLNKPSELLLYYLKNEVLEELTVSRENFLMLFVTNPDWKSFLSVGEYDFRPFGEYLYKVRITSNEACTDTFYYKLSIRSWNDYTFTFMGTFIVDISH
jgi:hypothetical protein